MSKKKKKKKETAAGIVLSRRLAAYSLAAGAALAFTQPAEAGIICGDFNLWLQVGDSFSVDLDGDGNSDLGFAAGVNSSSYYAMMFMDSGVAAPTDGFWWSNFLVNQPTSITLPPGSGDWVSSTYGILNSATLASSSMFLNAQGDFHDGIPGYIGVRLEINPGEYRYGWIEYTADLDPSFFGGWIGRWALETEVNQPIFPGDTGFCDPEAVEEDVFGGGCFITAGSD